MSRNLTVLIAVLALALTACGGGLEALDPGGQDFSQPSLAAPDGGAPAGGDASEPEPEPAGPVEANTIRIGSQVWSRTLPMTSGQCFLYEDDGTLPTSAVVWGTLDGNDELYFTATQNQDGTFDSEVNNGLDIYWYAGKRSPGVKDLTIELDFDTLTITGHGTYTALATNKTASGSFKFVCEPEES